MTRSGSTDPGRRSHGRHSAAAPWQRRRREAGTTGRLRVVPSRAARHAYGIANLVGTLPISPGGPGVVEGIRIPTLVGFGTPSATAVLAVVSWRLFEFWAPIPAGGLAYLSLHVQRWITASRSSPRW